MKTYLVKKDINKDVTWYELERKVGGVWQKEGYSTESLEEAKEELEWNKTLMPKEEFRIAEYKGNIIREKGQS